MHVELPIAAFIAAFVVLIPIPWHWRARQVSTLSIIIWLFLSNIIYAVNAIIWSDNVRVVMPVWCDIATKLQMGSNVALPAACLCLCIHLERIASVRQVSIDRKMKQRWFVFDILMCWGLPIIYMALHYVVQGHRFDIVEDFGCRPTTYVSVAAIFLVFLPPMILSMATFIVAGLALRHFFRRRASFSKHLQNSQSGLSSSHYFRLILMSLVEMVWSLTISSLNVAFTTRGGLRPWHDWNFVHSGFLQVGQFPLAVVPEGIRRWTFALWWAIPVSTFVFVAFFASGEEAMKEYRAIYQWCRRVVLRRPLAAPVRVSQFSYK
ncbi:fungal pheromone STE3G-protein-coupled receptor [Auriscalpium vulgare]|uniref:Fungal pheromone STE3G-protein-coupled receptor n=1 Tax=Auriscalpium vulgare TaxID=40419 RepID=A0ACB8SBA4_9AGAM|nr:fungal pheromone STE3G-protein-coupled receptor [Auriscalpium vulgare]